MDSTEEQSFQLKPHIFITRINIGFVILKGFEYFCSYLKKKKNCANLNLKYRDFFELTICFFSITKY